MNAIANGGPKHPHTGEIFFEQFSKGPKHSLRLFIVIKAPICHRVLATGSIICSLRLCQSLHDAKATAGAVSAIANCIPNCQSVKNEAPGSGKRALTKRDQAKFAVISVPPSLLKPFRIRPSLFKSIDGQSLTDLM